MFTLIFANSLQGFGFETFIKIAGLVASNWDQKQKVDDILAFQEIIRTASSREPLNNKEDYKDAIDHILKDHVQKDINFYHDTSLDLDIIPNAMTDRKDIFLSSGSVDALRKDFFLNSPAVTQSLKAMNNYAITHERGHIEEIEHPGTEWFKHFLRIGSNVVLYKTFDGILESNSQPIYKYGAIATLAGAKYALNCIFDAFDSRQKEKSADLYAINRTQDPLALNSCAIYYKTRIDIEPKPNIVNFKQYSTWQHFFSTHPTHQQRINAFENAARIRTAQQKGIPVDPKLRVYGKKLNDID